VVRRRTGELDEFGTIVADRAVRVVFQPIVRLDTGETIAVEALVRPPDGSSYTGPQDLFAEAYRRDLVGEFDWVCRWAAMRAVLDHPVPAEIRIFLNVEPAAMDAPCPVDLITDYAAAVTRFLFVVEVTERSLTDDPGELLAAVQRIHDVPAAVAIDDVGADADSLALMPLVAPEVIKLDLRLIQARPTPEVAAIVNAVMAEAERTGAKIVAEGIETAEHVLIARAMGATLGQGWFFGRPAPLSTLDITAPRRPLKLPVPPTMVGDSPFHVAASQRSPWASTKDLLAATSRHLEHEVLLSSSRPVVLSAFETVENFGAATRRRYERLAAHSALVAVFGRGMAEKPAVGVRGAPLAADDPLSRQWIVVVLDNHFSAALAAYHRPRDGIDEFDAVVTHDRELVLAIAKPLLSRLPPRR
jgi:EAL domain-containing protein (putative c-di-GMP-specific phosphodiesterase class I)